MTGIVQFGIVFDHYLNLTDAVRSGARTASVSRAAANPTATAVAAVRQAAGGLDAGRLDVQVDSDWQSGDDVTVSASYPYSLSIFGISFYSGSLESSTTERVE